MHADDPQADKLLLVMEYAEAGPVMRGDRSTEKVPLAEGVALKFFRDVLQVKGLVHMPLIHMPMVICIRPRLLYILQDANDWAMFWHIHC